MLIVLACSLLAVLLVMGTAFAVGRATGKYSIIDVLWGPGFAVIAVVAFVVSLGQGDTTVRLLMLAMVVIWGMRLGWYLLLRNRGLPEDRRYVELLGGAGGPWSIVRKVQVPQGLAMWFVSLPVDRHLSAGQLELAGVAHRPVAGRDDVAADRKDGSGDDREALVLVQARVRRLRPQDLGLLPVAAAQSLTLGADGRCGRAGQTFGAGTYTHAA